MVKRWFRELTDKAIRRGVFRSVPELVAAIENFLRVHNEDPKPFVWTATAESILAKVRRGRVTLEQVKAKTETLPRSASTPTGVLLNERWGKSEWNSRGSCGSPL